MNEIETLKKKLKQAQLAYQMAAQINQFKTGFLGRIAHELRSPLSSLMSIHQLILSDLCESPEEERQLLDGAYQSAQKMLAMIDEIVAISKIEYGTLSLQIRPAQLGQILSELEYLTHLQAANCNLQLEIIPPNPEILVMVDRERFLQGLVMLVDTAIAHLESGSIRVLLNISERENCSQLMIEFPGNLSFWQEAKSDLLDNIPDPVPAAIKAFGQQLEVSPATKLLLVKSLLEQMAVILEISAKTPEKLIQVKISIPLAQREKNNIKSG